MDIELITIGNELLLGQTIDTNAAEIARAVSAVGVVVVRATTVPDDERAIDEAVRSGLRRSGFVITTGGLGPTRDDVTRSAVATIFGAPMERSHEYLESLRQRFERMGRGPMPVSNASQADIPKGAVALPNPLGTAPGIWLEGAEGTVVMLPGVPREMRGLLENEVVPRLKPRAGDSVIISRTLRTAGVSESALADTLAGIEERIAPISLAYLPSVDGVDLRLTAWRLERQDAEIKLDDATNVLTPLLGRALYGTGDLAEVVLSLLRDRGLTIAAAESCTGGLLGQRLTAVPGASEVFLGGIVAYGNRAKQSLLGVESEVLAKHGAVSPEVAQAMATGAQERFGADVSVGITGIAGPGGGTPDKPVGTVYLSARVRNSEVIRGAVFPGDREDIRRRSAQGALVLVRKCLDEE